MAEGVPALVVSGFLGSGKTTLVRRLLEDAQRRGVRAAVVSNEFGELGIDGALLADAAAGFVEIEGGCVCCKLSDELLDTLEALRARVAPDRVIIETSGLALPYDTLVQLWREPVARWIGDSLSVVVVNAEQVHAGRELEGTFEDQVSSADLLLLNKIDLVPGEALPALEARLREVEPDAPLLRCVHGAVDPALLFLPDVGRARSGPPDAHLHEAFEAEELEVPDGIAPDALVALVRGRGALRAKGLVRTSEGLRLVQGVGPRVELDPAPDGRSVRVGRVVLIRRAISAGTRS